VSVLVSVTRHKYNSVRCDRGRRWSLSVHSEQCGWLGVRYGSSDCESITTTSPSNHISVFVGCQCHKPTAVRSVCHLCLSVGWTSSPRCPVPVYPGVPVHPGEPVLDTLASWFTRVYQFIRLYWGCTPGVYTRCTRWLGVYTRVNRYWTPVRAGSPGCTSSSGCTGTPGWTGKGHLEEPVPVHLVELLRFIEDLSQW